MNKKLWWRVDFELTTVVSIIDGQVKLSVSAHVFAREKPEQSDEPALFSVSNEFDDIKSAHAWIEGFRKGANSVGSYIYEWMNKEPETNGTAPSLAHQ